MLLEELIEDAGSLLEGYCMFDHNKYEYFKEAHDRLISSNEKLNILENKFKLKPETIKNVKLGINKENEWVVPIYKYSTEHNYELDEPFGCQIFSEDLKIIKTLGIIHPVILAMINAYNEKTESILLVKDFFEGYLFLQCLKENNVNEYFQIVTTSFGKSCLYNLMNEIDFKSYGNFYLCLGKDSESEKFTKMIKEAYPMFKEIKPEPLFENFTYSYFYYYSSELFLSKFFKK